MGLIRNNRFNILIVDDVPKNIQVAASILQSDSYHMAFAQDGPTALSQLESNRFDLILLDIMMPQMDGFEVCRRIRNRPAGRDTPIIFLTAKSMKEDRIEGLKIGADDYVTKPFSMEELLLRIEVFLRRNKISSEDNSEVYKIGTFDFDYSNLTLSREGKTDTLTQREADLLRYFARTPNQVLKRSDILLRVWGEDDYFLGRSLDVFVSRLRKYLKVDPDIRLENVHGVGFKLIA